MGKTARYYSGTFAPNVGSLFGERRRTTMNGMTDEEFTKILEHGRRSRRVMIMVTVYKHPHDFPHMYVGRVWFISFGKYWASPTTYIARDSIEDVRAAIPKWMTRMGKSENEDPVIVETYM